MAVSLLHNAFVNQTAATISLSQMFGVSADAADPAYLVLTALDRNEYTAGSTGATGSFTGNGHTLNFSNIGSDGRGAGIAFTYQSASGRYYNSTYGYLDQLVYNGSGNRNDVTNISLFGTSNLSLANQYAGNAWSAMQVSGLNYIGSVTVATQPHFAGSVPSQATPNSIAAVANSFIGQAWNMDGCWVLASTIAAQAGASLPVQSTEIGLPGKANGEWIVAFNGPTGQTGAWQNMVTAGEVIVIGTSGGGGHITTCVSGAGSTALLVDNITYVNSSGQVVNAANDGSSRDIIVATPHAASQEWAGVSASSVVIYQLDTPIVTATVTGLTLACNATQSLSALFKVVDPASRAITQWQIYDSATSDSLVYSGAVSADHSAAAALTVASLGALSLRTGTVSTVDTLDVRAFNGLYWGDWQTLAVNVIGGSTTPPPAQAPVVAVATAKQTWLAGQSISLALPANTFHDPQNQALNYSANLSSGGTLPSWLHFNAATDSFTGTIPNSAQALTLAVKATDTSGLSATDTFGVTIIGTPVQNLQTASQVWAEGQAISLILPSNTFSDPQGQALTYSAAQANGAALPSWLVFHPGTESFTGTAPTTLQNLSVKVTAIDSSGLSASESIAAAVKPGISVTNQTPNQVWTDNKALNVVLPGNTFTDALGLKMTFAAYETSGPNITSWLRFNPTTLAFTGSVPATQSGSAVLQIVASDGHTTAQELFGVTFAAASGHTTAGITAAGGSLYNLYIQPQVNATPLLHS